MDFRQELEKRNIPCTSDSLNKLETYASLLTEANKKINLTAITDKEEIYFKHFLDSLLIYPCLINQKSVFDIGSGAGFPGLPLAIFMKDTNFTLIEPTTKRCVFLEEVTKTLDLSNVKVVNKRSEDYYKEGIRADAAVSRAVARLNILAELCSPLVKKGGYFIAMKGPSYLNELEEAQNALKILNLELETTDIQSINGSTRVNLIFKKVNETPAKYPRNYGQIKKKPL